MAFEQTLRSVQASRAAATLFGCVSIIMFSFVTKMRSDARTAFVKELATQHPELFDIAEPTHGSWGSLALAGLALSVGWNGFCFFDLMIKKHYRFDRRVCIFVDIIVALILAVTGFLNFAYDAVVYFGLQLATGEQVKLEIVAVIFLTLAGLLHVAFFCYGCKDPAAAAMSFEHMPLDSRTPEIPSHEYDSRSVRSRANTYGNDDEELVEIDLGKKVEIIKFQTKEFSKDTSMRTPPRTPREGEEHKRLGFVGAPPQLATPKMKAQQPASSEQSPFLDAHATHEWI